MEALDFRYKVPQIDSRRVGAGPQQEAWILTKNDKRGLEMDFDPDHQKWKFIGISQQQHGISGNRHETRMQLG